MQYFFRYSYGGKPLLATTKLQDPGTCSLCGSPRQYELQLMSPLSYFLHEAGDGSSNYAPSSWTWLTVIIYTCSKVCLTLQFPDTEVLRNSACPKRDPWIVVLLQK